MDRDLGTRDLTPAEVATLEVLVKPIMVQIHEAVARIEPALVHADLKEPAVSCLVSAVLTSFTNMLCGMWAYTSTNRETNEFICHSNSYFHDVFKPYGPPAAVAVAKNAFMMSRALSNETYKLIDNCCNIVGYPPPDKKEQS